MHVKPLFAAGAGLVAGITLVALLPTAAVFQAPPQPDAHARDAGGGRWACPMMDFIGNKPGDCPVCGMELQPVSAGELTEEQQRRVGLELTTISEAAAVATIRAYGTVRYDDRTAQAVIPRVAGRVVRRFTGALHAGTYVRKGDPLVDLYSPEAYAAQGELAAAVALGDQPTITSISSRFERWNLAPLARAIIEGNAPVDTFTITSPFEGRVYLPDGDAMGSRLPQVGEELMPDRVIVRLVDPFQYIVSLQVPETRARWLREGQPVSIASDDMGELPDVQASVSWVAPELDLQLRSREIHLHLDDPEGRLLPGSLVNARIKAALGPDLRPADPQTPDAWGHFVVVPKTAVISTGVRNVAWRVAERQPDGRLRFEIAPLALGPRIEDEQGNDVFVIRSGLKAGDTVATQGLFLIDSQAQLAGSPSLLFPQGALAPAPEHQH